MTDLAKWSSHYYSIIPGLSWPILDWGRARANVVLQGERRQQALVSYEATVAGALRDVEVALVQYQAEQIRQSSLRDAATAAQQALTMARQQFEHGIVDLTIVLDAQRELLSVQDAEAQSDAAIATDLVALYKALGGGWENQPESDGSGSAAGTRAPLAEPDSRAPARPRSRSVRSPLRRSRQPAPASARRQ
jgi:outer membrane protein TolC